MDELVRLRKENEELRNKLKLAIEIIYEFIDSEHRPEMLTDIHTDKKRYIENHKKTVNS